MSYYEAPVPAQEDTVIRPVIRKVLEQVASTWFADCPEQLHYLDHTNQRHPVGTYRSDDVDQVHLNADSRFEATATIKVNNNTLFTQEHTNDNVVPCWADSSISSYVNLRRVTKEVELRIRYTASSRGEAQQWLSQYQHRVISGMLQFSEDCAYEVVVPPAFPTIICELHRVRELNAGYGDDVDEYLYSHMLVPAKAKPHPNNQGRTLVFKEVLRNIGVSVPSEIPEITRTDTGGWETELLLEFRLDVPSMLTFHYSIYIHGNMISPTYFDQHYDRNATSRIGFTHGSQHGRLSGQMHDKFNREIRRTDGYIYPPFDNRYIDLADMKVVPVVQVRMCVDPEQPRFIQDLNTLASDIGIQLHPDLIPFMLEHNDIAFNRFLSVFTLFICGKGKPLDPSRYTLNSDGTIVSDYDLDQRQEYHLVLAIRDDLPSITESLIRPLTRKGKLFTSILRYCYPDLKPEHLPKMDSNGVVSRSELLKVGKQLPTRMKPFQSRTFLSSAIITEAK